MTGKKKTKRIKKEKYQTEEQTEIIRFVKILLVIIILVIGVYLFTRLFVTKDLLNRSDSETNTATPGEINYDITTIGTMFNKPEEEYYVIMYSAEDLNAIYYSGLASAYSENKDALKVYFVDLNNELNKKYVGFESENVSTNDLNEFKIDDLALIRIKNGKNINSLTSEEDIAKELAYINK